jgi:uncharacterized membrane protein YccC
LPAVSAVWRTVKRVDKAKINDRFLAFRNSLAVAVPLAVGITVGNSLAGVAVATGALNVSYADGKDPYGERARRMLLWSVLCAVAVFIGSITGASYWGAIITAAIWAFAAGMMMGVSTHAGDLGLNTLVSVIVFAARGVATPRGAFYSGLLVLGGGLLQTLFAVFFWPVRGDKPQREAVGKAYQDLANEVDPNQDTGEFAAVKAPSVHLEDTLSALGRDHTVEGERYRLLFDQADRLRLSIYLVSRLRDGLGEGDDQHSEADADSAEALDKLLTTTSILLRAVGDCLVTGRTANDLKELQAQLDQMTNDWQERKHRPDVKLAEKIANAVDVMTGQLRLVVQLAANTTPRGERDFLKRAENMPWKLHATNWLASMRANMDWRSPIFRHALRLTACVAVGDVIERSISWERTYWLPMTVAVVLKPDFTTTFSRGALRLMGTIAGLILATLVYHFLPQSAWTQLMLVGAYTFLLRYLGPANYGVFTMAVSGLIVFLIAATGIAPAGVVWARGLNTIAGGLLALAAYTVWPTWERVTVSHSVAQMLDATRVYFRAVVDCFGAQTGVPENGTLDETRRAWRRARTEAEASVDRVASEPGSSPATVDCLHSMLASSHALIHAVMGLEAGVIQTSAHTRPAAFRAFSNDVEFTLYYLALALRGSEFANKTLPVLREDHRRMLESRGSFSPVDQYVLLETDRMTVSLNTLREQVVRYRTGCT